MYDTTVRIVWPSGAFSNATFGLTAKLVIFVLSLVIVGPSRNSAVAQILQTCNGEDPCRCTMSDNTGTVDVSSLGSYDGKPSFPDGKDFNGNSFAYNPCFSVSLGDCRDAAVCKNNVDGSYTDFGTQKSAVWSYNGFYPVVTYTSASGRQRTEVLYICDENFQTPQYDVIGEISEGNLAINLWSKCACPNKCERVDPPASSLEGGLTPGSIMLIIFFTAVLVYVAAGVTYNRTRNNAGGKDLVPNLAFWAAIPGLIKEGVLFTWARICRRSSDRGTYEAM